MLLPETDFKVKDKGLDLLRKAETSEWQKVEEARLKKDIELLRESINRYVEVREIINAYRSIQ